MERLPPLMVAHTVCSWLGVLDVESLSRASKTLRTAWSVFFPLWRTSQDHSLTCFERLWLRSHYGVAPSKWCSSLRLRYCDPLRFARCVRSDARLTTGERARLLSALRSWSTTPYRSFFEQYVYKTMGYQALECDCALLRVLFELPHTVLNKNRGSRCFSRHQ